MKRQYWLGHKTSLLFGFCVILLLLGSCSGSEDIGLQGELAKDDNPGYVKLDLSFNSSFFTTKDMEKKVKEVRFMAFDSESGECVKNLLLRFNGLHDSGLDDNSPISTSDLILLPIGKYNFVFIGNETSNLLTDNFRQKIAAVAKQSELDGTPFIDVIYDQGKNIDLFPMSAYYSEVVVEKDEAVKIFTQKVSLVRAVAKVEMSFINKDITKPTYKRIHSIKLVNIPQKYTFPASSKGFYELYDPADLYAIEIKDPFSESDYAKEEIGRITMYIPEFIRYDTDPQENFTSVIIEGEGFYPTTLPLKHSNYEIFKIPRVLDYENLSDYSVLRDAIYNISVGLGLQGQLETILTVANWQKIESDVTFTKPVWDKDNFKIGIRKKGEISISQYVTDKKEIELHSGEEAVIFFKLIEPKAVAWTASLTNIRDFVFDDNKDTWQGQTGVNTEIVLSPRNEWSGSLKYSEFYIAVNGYELPLFGEASGLGNRYIFKQVE